MSNLPHALSLFIQRAHSLAEILQHTVRLITEEMGTDVCSIYLLEPGTRSLVLTATEGLSPSAVGKVRLELGEGLTGRAVQEMRALAVEDASSHPGYRYFPETEEERFHSFLAVPLSIQTRPVGAIVVQTSTTRSYREDEIQTLTTIAAQLVGVVENARLVEALERQHADRYLDGLATWSEGTGRTDLPDETLRGTAVSAGIAIGPVVRRGMTDVSVDNLERSSEGYEAEWSRVETAISLTRRDIARIQEAAEKETDEEHALIFSSHLLVINDPVVHDQIRGRLREGHPAERAVWDTVERFVEKLASVSDAYIRDRVEDLYDLRQRLLSHTGSEHFERNLGEKVVVAPTIAPSLVIELKAEGARGIVSLHGGATSHGALLARSMGIPAVTGVGAAARRIAPGELVVLDGGAGKLVRSPSAETLARYEARAHELSERARSTRRFFSLPGKTADGRSVSLRANVSVTADLRTASEVGADGVGLYRTEFPFLIRERFPTLQEQVRIYEKVFEHFPRGPARFRLLDLGGDKLVPVEGIEADRDPFRGFRSLRLLLSHPEILREQVAAFVRAAAGRPVEILIPMVTTLPHLREAIALIRDAAADAPAGSVSIGAMIEVPAAVTLAGAFARECDFLAIGSNDLVQYTLAVDRENERAASEDDPYHPAVLNAIAQVIAGSHEHEKPVTLCGEMASERRFAALLIALGIDALSLAPGAIPELKRLLSETDITPVEEARDSILAIETGGEIRSALAHLLGEG